MGRTRAGLNRLPRGLVVGLGLPAATTLAVFLACPTAHLVRTGLGAGGGLGVLTSARTWDVIVFTLGQALVSTALTLAIGLAPTHVVARYGFPGRSALIGLLSAVFVLPTVVMGAAVHAVVPGWRGLPAILVAHVLFNLAVVVRVVGPLWSRLPQGLADAAATLGAGPLTRVRMLWSPLLAPASRNAGVIVFALTLTSFGVIRILGTPGQATLEVEIWRRAIPFDDLGGAAVLSMLQLLLLVGALVVTRGGHAALGEIGEAARPRTRRARLWVGGTALATAALLLFPLGAMALRSVRSTAGFSLAAWRATLGGTSSPAGVDPLTAIGASLQTAALAAVLALGLGITAALGIAAAGRLGGLLDLAVMAPLGVSAVTVGLGMLITFSAPPLDWRGRWWILPLGHALIALPFVVRVTLPVLRAVPAGLTEAAATLGASPVRAWARVVLPQAGGPALVAVGLAAAISLGEFGAASLLSRSGAETLPLVIERLLGRTGTLLQAQAHVLATVLATLTIGLLALVERVARHLPGGERARGA